jgi:uncharacterized protein YmfQ (DUF2313 family)
MPSPPRDRHIRRGGKEYLKAFLGLLPLGIAWPRKPDSVLVKTSRGLTNIWGFVDDRAADLLEIESDPRKTTDPSEHDPPPDGLLPEWERAWGLPDPCLPNATSPQERRDMLLLVMTMLGGQSRAFFEGITEWASGDEIHITEFSPYMCGISMCGDTSDIEFAISGVADKMRWELGAPEIRYYWTARTADPELIWFRCGEGGPEEALQGGWTGGECGVDTHLQIIVAPDLDCLLNRWKPAHTQLVFDYSQSELLDDPMAGTP